MDYRLNFSLFPTESAYKTIIPSRELNEKEINLLHKVFQDCDAKNKDYLSREDFKIAVVLLFGYKPSKYEVDQMIGKYCQENPKNGGLNFEQFLEVMKPKLFAKNEDEEIRQTFMAFDSQCNGFLKLEDLKKVFSQVAPNFPAHRIDNIFRELDSNGDGRVSFKDFDFLMKHGNESAIWDDIWAGVWFPSIWDADLCDSLILKCFEKVNEFTRSKDHTRDGEGRLIIVIYSIINFKIILVIVTYLDLNKVFYSKFHTVFRVQQEDSHIGQDTPEEGPGLQWPKHCENSPQNKNSSLKNYLFSDFFSVTMIECVTL